MNYNSKIGILENVKLLFKQHNETKVKIDNLYGSEKFKSDLETANSIVETVIDEYNAVIGE